jgi:hypothetical protein
MIPCNCCEEGAARMQQQQPQGGYGAPTPYPPPPPPTPAPYPAADPRPGWRKRRGAKQLESADSAQQLHGFTEAVSGIAESVREGLKHAAPDSVEIEFGPASTSRRASPSASSPTRA